MLSVLVDLCTNKPVVQQSFVYVFDFNNNVLGKIT